MKRFDYIVIEASGICEPAPIAQTICSIPSLGPQYIENGILRLDSIVTVVDALRMKDEFSNGSDLMKKNMDEEDLASLVIQQIEFCNIILLNKAAEVEPKELEHLKPVSYTHLDVYKRQIRERSVVVRLIGSHILNLINHIHAFKHLSEYSVAVVKVRNTTMLDVCLLYTSRCV